MIIYIAIGIILATCLTNSLHLKLNYKSNGNKETAISKLGLFILVVAISPLFLIICCFVIDI
jgi:hypothetical protein